MLVPINDEFEFGGRRGWDKFNKQRARGRARHSVCTSVEGAFMRRDEGQPNFCRFITNSPSAARPPSLHPSIPPLLPDCIVRHLRSPPQLLSSSLRIFLPPRSTPSKMRAALSIFSFRQDKMQPSSSSSSTPHPSLTQKQTQASSSCLSCFSALIYSARSDGVISARQQAEAAFLFSTVCPAGEPSCVHILLSTFVSGLLVPPKIIEIL